MYGSSCKSYLQMLDSVHHQGHRFCLGTFRTSPVESLYIDAHKPCLGARLQSLVTLNILNITVFDNKYMKLFDARKNAIHTFGLCIKQFLTGFNILETLSYFVLPPWCIKPLKIVLDQVQLKEDHTDASVYQQLFMAIKGRSHSCLYRWFTGWKLCDL